MSRHMSLVFSQKVANADNNKYEKQALAPEKSQIQECAQNILRA